MTKIIIVEDDPMLSDIYQMKFSSSGFEVSVAENGKVALDIIKKEKIDIVLVDIVMPEMDGFELTRILRSGNYDSKIKIIIVSNLDQEDIKKKFADLKIDGFIAKSNYNPTELVEEVQKIINR